MGLLYHEPGGPYLFDGWPEALEGAVQGLFVDDAALDEVKEASMRIRCCRGPLTEAPLFDVPFSVGHDVPLRVEGTQVFGPGFALELGSDLMHASLTLFDPERAALAVANALRVCVAHRVLRTGGLMVHSAALLDAHGAHLFFGRSGDGKSTLTRAHVNRKARALSDDLNVIWCAERLEVEALERAGEVRPATRGRHALCSIARLQQGPSSRRIALEETRAYAMLLAAVPFVGATSAAGDRIVEILSRIQIEQAFAGLNDSAVLVESASTEDDVLIDLAAEGLEWVS